MAAARRRKGEPPSYNHHKGSGQAYCTVAGERVYLGVHGTPKSRKKYKAVLRAWEDSQGPAAVARPECLIIDLVAAFLDWARRRFQIEGEPTSSMERFASSFKPLLESYGDVSVDNFRAKDLKALRQKWVDAGLAEGSISQYVKTIRQLFRWGLGEEAVDAGTVASLESTKGQREGRETEPVGPVEWNRVEKTIAHLPPPLADMIEANFLIGCRPGEICRLRGREINFDGLVALGRRRVQLDKSLWVWKPERFKTRAKRKDLVYLIGPKAQKVLNIWLRKDPDAYLFQPGEAWPERKGPRPCFNEDQYYYAIQVACEVGKIEPWTPNQLRHATATLYDREAGIQAASLVLGHASIATTSIYAESNIKQAAELVKKFG